MFEFNEEDAVANERRRDGGDGSGIIPLFGSMVDAVVVVTVSIERKATATTTTTNRNIVEVE